SNSISGNFISCIFEDSKNRLWVGTAYNGLNLFDRETETFTRFRNSTTNTNSLSNNKIVSVQEDKTGGIWVGTSFGLNKLRIKGKRQWKTPPPKTKTNDFSETHEAIITKVNLADANPANELFKVYESVKDDRLESS